MLSCKQCNRGQHGKFAQVPSVTFLSRLYRRNEFLNSSHHPLRETIIAQTGKTKYDRANFLKIIDNFAINFLVHRWTTENIGPIIF